MFVDAYVQMYFPVGNRREPKVIPDINILDLFVDMALTSYLYLVIGGKSNVVEERGPCPIAVAGQDTSE